jgi:hypothetical protein
LGLFGGSRAHTLWHGLELTVSPLGRLHTMVQRVPSSPIVSFLVSAKGMPEHRHRQSNTGVSNRCGAA